ncbi:MAG TPA: HIT family protein [Arenimonas sp.]|nr:HIT family protein [Arenimonas sp.]HPO24778.1 HIT family protein [Arenimonas sp.]HPW33967.1 HIT family protein [Arenimonas sp.]
MSSRFILDARLEADSVFIADGELSQFRLMNDARYPWLVLVPKVADAIELTDLPVQQQHLLLSEINIAAKILRDYIDCEKINIGALGNIVRQLHVHVIARTMQDAAWPGPVWGQGTTQHYDDATLSALIRKFQSSF